MNNKEQYMLTIELIDKYKNIALERFAKIALIFLNSDLYKNKTPISLLDEEIEEKFPLLINFPNEDVNEIFDYDSLDSLNRILKVKLGKILIEAINKNTITFVTKEDDEIDYTDYIFMPTFITYQTDEEFYNYTTQLKKTDRRIISI